MKDSITAQLDELTEVISRFRACTGVVSAAGEELVRCLKAGGAVLTCGNGGSAADALHLAEELTGRFRGDRRALPGLCLNADPTALTCIANDFGFESIFSRQIEALGRPQDVLVAFSTSGYSRNVIRALEAASKRGIYRILLTGMTGGKAAGLSDQVIRIPSEVTARIQEMHTFVLHAWLERIEGEFIDGGTGL